MRFLIDLTATSGSSSGLNTWTLGLLEGIKTMASRDEWVVVGTKAMPDVLRDAAQAAGAETIVYARHRGLVQQFALPHVARGRRLDGLLAASTVLPLWRRGTPAVAVLYDFRHRDQPQRYGQVQRRYRNLAYRFAVRNAERLVAISAETARAALREDAACGPRMRVVYPGADHVDRWPRTARGGHGITFAQWANKEPQVAISAWVHSVRQGVPPSVLHVVGAPDSQRSSLARHVSDLDASALVRLHGRLEDAEYQRLFTSAAVVLLTSSAEGLGLPVLEALRLGIPLVASDLPAVREVAGECAWYGAPGDVADFAAAISQARAAPPPRLEAGRLQVARFTWLRCAEEVTESLTLAARK